VRISSAFAVSAEPSEFTTFAVVKSCTFTELELARAASSYSAKRALLR